MIWYLPLLEVLSLALVHDQDDSVVHRLEVGIGEAGWVHLELGLTNVRFVLAVAMVVVAHTGLPRRDIFLLTASRAVPATLVVLETATS